jgi:translation initiation factor 1
MNGGNKLPMDGGRVLGQNPFAGLSSIGLPAAPKQEPGEPISPAKAQQKNRGRIDMIRSTAGRGGKTVTVITGFMGIGLPEKEALAKKMRAACGCGGTIKDGNIEIQGDQREKIAVILAEAGFRPVLAGG